MAENKIPEQPQVIVPWWQDGASTSDIVKEPYFLSKGVTAFFKRLKTWLLFPLQQTDALTCSESLLDLMAWDRDISRFESEPLTLFRKRVKFAVINAKDAGSVAGFKAIFERLDIAIVNFKERQSGVDWDVITIEVDDQSSSYSSKLIKSLIEQYGRTCRRYSFQVTYKSKINIIGGEFTNRFALYKATLN